MLVRTRLRDFVPAEVTSLVSELVTDLASSLLIVSVSEPWKRTTGSVILRSGSSESGLGLAGRLTTEEGCSYVEARRDMGWEKAARGREGLLGTEEERGSRGAENSCRCKAAPECTNILAVSLVLGKDAPRAGGAFPERSQKERRIRDQKAGGTDGSRVVVVVEARGCRWKDREEDMRKRPGYVRMWAVARGNNAGEASDDEGGPVRRQRVAESCYTVLCRLYYLGNARSGGTNEDAGRVAAGAMMHSTTDVKSRGLWEFVGWRLYAGCWCPKWFDIALLSPCHEPSARKLRTNVRLGSSKDESQKMDLGLLMAPSPGNQIQ